MPFTLVSTYAAFSASSALYVVQRPRKFRGLWEAHVILIPRSARMERRRIHCLCIGGGSFVVPTPRMTLALIGPGTFGMHHLVKHRNNLQSDQLSCPRPRRILILTVACCGTNPPLSLLDWTWGRSSAPQWRHSLSGEHFSTSTKLDHG